MRLCVRAVDQWNVASKIETPASHLQATLTFTYGLVATMLLIVVFGMSANGADAAERSFKPVDKSARALFFKPKGIEASQVKKAHVKLRRNSDRIQRRVGAVRVRRALRTSTATRSLSDSTL